MRPPQARQAAPSRSQLSTGMLSRLAIGWLHWRQWDRGCTTDSPAGSRTMQTFRKLPSSKPHIPKKTQAIIVRRRSVILKRIGYIVGMSPERDQATDPAALFAEAVSIMSRLRGPDGCPWDREQSFDTIRKYTLEECYEVFDAIERRHWPDLCEELGDLLLQVLFYAQMASEPGYFTIADVIAGINRKLVRRHPHVFGDDASLAAGNAVTAPLETADIDSGQVLRNWDAIKRAEKQGSSALDSIPRGLPALMEASKLGARAQKSGFDWPDLEGIFAKLDEETEELRQAIDQHPGATAPEVIVSEVGDLLFTLVNLARRLHVEPEFALRHTNAKFRRRFAAMEAASSQPLETMSADELESLWSQAKLAESPSPSR
jgi:nucleoside triphosphate diphosphatase